MITINLLPKNEKKELHLLRLYVIIKNIIFLLLVGVIISSIILLLGKITLLNHFADMIAESSIYPKAFYSSTVKIKSLKKDLEAAKEVQKNHISWKNFFINLNSVVNEGVTVEGLEVSSQGKLKIKGLAKSRQSLLDFEKNIQESGFFGDFKFPYEIFFKKENIAFNAELKFDVKKITENK